MAKRTKGKEPATPPPKPDPSDKERAAIAEADARRLARPNRVAVAVESVDGKTRSITSPHSDHPGWCARLADALGTSTAAFARMELARVMDALGVKNSDAETTEMLVNAALAAIEGQRPENEMEALLVAQMVATHAMAMGMLGRIHRADQRWQVETYGTLATKLQRTFIAQCEAFAKMRRGGQQKVRVEHVHVYPGGQAVVGNVVTGGGGRQEDAEQAQTVTETASITYAPGQTVWGADPARVAVPAAGNAEG